jgi:hypothetical protein
MESYSSIGDIGTNASHISILARLLTNVLRYARPVDLAP